MASTATRTPGAAGQPPLKYFDPIIGYGIPETQTHLNLTVANLFDTTPPTVGAFPAAPSKANTSALGRVYLLTLDQKL